MALARRRPGEENLTVEEQVAALEAMGVDPFVAHIGNLEYDTLKRKPTEKKFFMANGNAHRYVLYRSAADIQLATLKGDSRRRWRGELCSQAMAAKALPVDLREKA